MDKHLNLFRFFNNSSYEFWENNLSRAFAICLQNDATLLSSVLKKILGNEMYVEASNYDTNIDVDLQRKVTQLENYTYIYAVACSGIEISEQEIQEIKARDIAEEPKTDLLITVGDICILFEFKRTEEDCAAQLKQQAEIVKKNSPECKDEIKSVDFNWTEILKICLSVLSFERKIKKENVFLKDFIDFIEMYNPNWFPEKKLSEISFPVQNSEDEYPNIQYLNKRLNTIQDYVFGQDNTKWIADRYVISIDEPWAKELRVWYDNVDGNNCLTVDIYPGDTKAQGIEYFREGKVYNWENKQICNYRLEVSYYLKFSHFNKGITWLWLNTEECEKTHNYEFFSKWTGRYNEYWAKKWKKKFAKELSEVIPDWKERTEWEETIEKSNRNYFDLSVGTHLRVLIPYNEAQKLDNTNSNDNKLADRIRKIYKEIKQEIEKN